jgi:hypothetical protein
LPRSELLKVEVLYEGVWYRSLKARMPTIVQELPYFRQVGQYSIYNKNEMVLELIDTENHFRDREHTLFSFDSVFYDL